MRIAGAVFLLTSLLTLQTHAATQVAGPIRLIDPPQKAAPLIFTDQDHMQHALSDYRGRYLLLTIWASWCGPCVKEMPSLDALQTRYDIKKVMIIPLSEDHGDDVVASFYQNHGVKHLPVAIDAAGMAPRIFQLHGLPTTMVIDPQGNEIASIEGSVDWTSQDTLNFLHALMH